ncbi:Hypothetical_protein [Hexamita inflata]|uniref:Hypothetical_protein n=1 Tax=Hexamita inflata TaxID=28002 RepID=A0AA86RCL4_9EUKA|nr:Hypothetical protein HINF_LOCUS13512 [Hexamita inflata]CAI9970659.1 Hypothetical protein HINF_LOCUS58304 [Hexamita inflata]CAI9970662.1 Hypothetical protein HINF_LOCUS58307 [Hexamita inflata]CAI9970664.1 Hypothetical protein HINF_LOCUS58309 [Hexamita inflata]CAI9970667.1 Hypothetical protein HINF_LOCUS58312 [Hexamita inflata]
MHQTRTKSRPQMQRSVHYISTGHLLSEISFQEADSLLIFETYTFLCRIASAALSLVSARSLVFRTNEVCGGGLLTIISYECWRAQSLRCLQLNTCVIYYCLS